MTDNSLAVWASGLCPICLSSARTCPCPNESLAILCDRCGSFDVSDAAEDVLDAYAGPLDRRRLSEILCDVCAMADCERPMIDSITASALIGLAIA